jgi:hypothetical protein
MIRRDVLLADQRVGALLWLTMDCRGCLGCRVLEHTQRLLLTFGGCNA